MPEHSKDPARVRAGLMATIHNKNTSEEAKKNAMEKLKAMEKEEEPAKPQRVQTTKDTVDESRVLAGFKATLNPYTSAKAKAHAKEVLQAAGIYEENTEHSDEQHWRRVLAGYKAALRNPHVSKEAKDHARDVLRENGVEVQNVQD